MPKLTDISNRTESDPENNNFLYKTSGNFYISF